MNSTKSLQELDLRDAFMFSAVMMNPEICKEVLERILQIKIRSVHVDTDLLYKGHTYDELPSSFVIFICDYDPFGLKKYCYSFSKICKEASSLQLEDGCQTIFLNTMEKMTLIANLEEDSRARRAAACCFPLRDSAGVSSQKGASTSEMKHRQSWFNSSNSYIQIISKILSFRKIRFYINFRLL